MISFIAGFYVGLCVAFWWVGRKGFYVADSAEICEAGVVDNAAERSEVDAGRKQAA